MSYFDQIYTRLFGQGTRTKVLVNGVLKRSASFADRFLTWRSSDACAEFLNDLWESYFWKRQGVDKNPSFALLESTCSNGFAIDYTSEYGKNNFRYLFDYLAEQVKLLDYRLVVGRHTLEEKGEVVELKEMRYLKPKRDFIEPMDQKFGNVQIEYVEENDVPIRIKLIANSYSDRKYNEPLAFEDLAEHVLSMKKKM